MGSSLSALVGRSLEHLEPIAAGIGSRCVALPQGLVLVPLPEDVVPDHWQDAFEEFSDLPPSVADAAGAASTYGRIAYVENLTFAGEGVQRAVVWDGGAVAWGPRHTCDVEADAGGELVHEPDHLQTAVNAALRELGVDRGDAFDEYAALGLHLKRSTEDWLDDD